MPITKKNKDEIFINIASDFSNNASVPIEQFKGCAYGVFAAACSIAVQDLYEYSEQNIKEAITLQNYTGSDLEEVASYINITRKSPASASGQIFAQGALNTSIPINSDFSYNDIIYRSTADREIISNTLAITNISRAGTIATITTASDHNLASGTEITTSGTGVTNFNRTATITLISSNSFSIAVDNTGATSATTGLITYLGTNIPVLASTQGANTNVSGSVNLTPLSITLSICGTTLYGLSGGADVETDDSLNKRFFERARNYTNIYTISGLPSHLKNTYSELTDVFISKGYLYQIPITSIEKDPSYPDHLRKVTFSQVHPFRKADRQFKEITGASASDLNVKNGGILEIYNDYSVLIEAENKNTTDEDNSSVNMKMAPYYTGSGSIFLYKRNSINKIYTLSELDAIKTYLIHSVFPPFDGANFLVSNFAKKSHTFTFLTLTPNIASIRTAITNNLIAWSKTLDPSVKTIYRSDYEAIIRQSYDANGNTVKTFTLDSPGDISLAVNELLDITSSDVIF